MIPPEIGDHTTAALRSRLSLFDFHVVHLCRKQNCELISRVHVPLKIWQMNITAFYSKTGYSTLTVTKKN